MPCSDGERLSRLDAATRAACNALIVLESKGHARLLDPETRSWWERHQERDRDREREYRDRSAALKKLTPRERHVLDLDGC